ncbi:MAG: acyltransferase family protein [Lactobacillaceae bacterium]|jgi:fucose 4-O-acetylase-like acetyltransferase|nr:acyltransferase family protein [Lactobacillaceae bacterium]
MDYTVSMSIKTSYHVKRIRYLDITRGIAMMMVIAGHIIQPEILGQELRYYLFAVHLPLFLIISGVLFKEKDSWFLIKKDTKQLLYPYVIGVLLIVLVFIIGYYQPFSNSWHHIVTGNLNSVPQILMAAFLVNGGDHYLFWPNFATTIGAIWYLVAFFEVSFIFNLLLKFIKNRYVQLLLIVGLTAIGYVIGNITALPFQLLSALVMLPFMAVGYYTKKYWFTNNVGSMKINISLIALGIILWTYSASHGILLLVSAQATQGPILATIAGIMGSFAMMVAIRYIDSMPLFDCLMDLLVKVGQVSLYMLVVHTIDLRDLPVSFVAMKLFAHFFHSNVAANYFAFVVGIAFAFVGGLILQRIMQVILKDNIPIKLCI